MPTYKCRKCGSEFKKIDPLILLPVCERCKREKEQLKVLKRKNTKTDSIENTEAEGSAFLGFVVLVVIIFIGWLGLKVWAGISYWDKIYVKNNLKTYSTEDFKAGNNNVNISTVKFNDDAKVSLDVTAYNILSGEEKNITLILPIYKLWTREHKNDSNVILRYQQPWLNDGEDYIKPTDAIIEDSPEFTNMFIDM